MQELERIFRVSVNSGKCRTVGEGFSGSGCDGSIVQTRESLEARRAGRLSLVWHYPRRLHNGQASYIPVGITV